jgi:hypothetical protein
VWKLPTFSAREWRSAALAALGANGSCTCTKSSGSTEQLLHGACDVHGDRDVALRAPDWHDLAGGEEDRLAAALAPSRRRGSSRASRSARRELAANRCELDGATIITRWPRLASSRATALDV